MQLMCFFHFMGHIIIYNIFYYLLIICMKQLFYNLIISNELHLDDFAPNTGAAVATGFLYE